MAERKRSEEAQQEDFKLNLAGVIECFSKQHGSGTPDDILAEFLSDCLKALDKAIVARTKFYENLPKTPPPEN